MSAAPSQVTLLQSQTGPGQVSGPGLSVVFGGVASTGVSIGVDYRAAGLAGRKDTVNVSDQVGTLVFDPSIYGTPSAGVVRSIKLVAVLECSILGQTCALELFNISDGATVVTLTGVLTVPTTTTSADLPVGNGAGQLPNSQKLYGLRLTKSGGGVADTVGCSSCYLEVSYT